MRRHALPAGHPDIAENLGGLRSLAHEYYRKQGHGGAERLLRMLLDEHFELPDTLCHLARIFGTTDRDTEARRAIKRAWIDRAEAPPYVVACIVFFQLLFALLDSSNAPPGDGDRAMAHRIGRLKIALQSENAHMEWDVQAMPK